VCQILLADVEDPDGDLPHFMVLDREEAGDLVFLPEFSDAERDAVFHRDLPQLIATRGAQGLAFAFPAWCAPGAGTPSEHPDREECVVIIVIAADGDESVLQAPLIRSEDRPPRLGAFERSPQVAPLPGPLADVFRQALGAGR